MPKHHEPPPQALEPKRRRILSVSQGGSEFLGTTKGKNVKQGNNVSVNIGVDRADLRGEIAVLR
jgi:hypothetical protein